MQGPHYEYLTNSYVEWLELEVFPFIHPEPVCVWVPEFAVKPVSMTAVFEAVVYNHALYLRERDGLAWSRKP